MLSSVRPQAAYPGVEQPPPHHPPYYHHSHPPPPPHQAYHHHHHHPPLPQHEAPPPRFRDKQRPPPQHRTFASSPVSGALAQPCLKYTAKRDQLKAEFYGRNRQIHLSKFDTACMLTFTLVTAPIARLRHACGRLPAAHTSCGEQPP